MVTPDASAGFQRVTSVDFLALAAGCEGDVTGLHCVAELVAIGRGDQLTGRDANRFTQIHVLTMSRNHRPSIRPAEWIVGEKPVHSEVEQAVKRALSQGLIRCLYSTALRLYKGCITKQRALHPDYLVSIQSCPLRYKLWL